MLTQEIALVKSKLDVTMSRREAQAAEVSKLADLVAHGPTFFDRADNVPLLIAKLLDLRMLDGKIVAGYARYLLDTSGVESWHLPSKDS